MIAWFKYEGKLKYFGRQISVQQKRTSLLPQSRKSLNSSSSEASSEFMPKLNKLEVPKFDVNILNFSNFRALFQNMIPTREEMSNVHKL